ncbi:hypothetical protein CLOM_g15520, partial [Closterium sp. NIES-68]
LTAAKHARANATEAVGTTVTETPIVDSSFVGEFGPSPSRESRKRTSVDSGSTTPSTSAAKFSRRVVPFK